MTSLFDTQNDLPPSEPKNFVAELVGDNKKFKTVEDLAKGKWEADQFIALKNREFDQLRADYLKLREDYNSGPKVQELLDQIALQNANKDSTMSNEDNKAVQFDPKQIDDIVSNRLSEYERQKRANDNANMVKDELKKRFGNNYQNALNEQLDTLGLTKEYADKFAVEQPMAFLRLVAPEQAKQDNFQAPPQTQRRSDNFAPAAQKRTWSYYQELRKNDPKTYLDTKTINQMHKDAQELGDAFNDGDAEYWARI